PRCAIAAGTPPEEREEPYDLDPAERARHANGVSPETMWENFSRSRFAGLTPLMAEQPFILYVGEGLSLEGRIDAIFETADGWEVVDYKTGKSDPDPLQLAIYGRAVREIWGREASCKWLLLRDGSEVDAPPVPNLEQQFRDAAARLQVVGR